MKNKFIKVLAVITLLSAFSLQASVIKHPTCLIRTAVEALDDRSAATDLLKFKVNQLLNNKGWNVIQTSSKELRSRVKLINAFVGSEASIVSQEDEFHLLMMATLWTEQNSFNTSEVKYTMSRFAENQPHYSEVAYNMIDFSGSEIFDMSDERAVKKAIRKLKLQQQIPVCEKTK